MQPSDTPELHTARIPWIAMLAATALLVGSTLAACRLAPSARQRTSPPQSTTLSQARLALTSASASIQPRIHSSSILPPVSSSQDQMTTAQTGQAPAPITIHRSTAGYTLSHSRQIIPGDYLYITAATGILTLGEGTDAINLEGEINLVSRSDAAPNAFDVIETIPLERYLPGVLAKELYHDFHEQAYEAQAIASRSYALHERNRRRALGSHFDVEASTVDQAYAGTGAHPKAEAAVAATAGQTLAYNGRVLRAYYSSTCGDRPASAKDTWPVTRGFEFNRDAPIQAHNRICACSKSPKHRWSLTRPADETAARLRAWGVKSGKPIKNISQLRAINIHTRNTAGRPSHYQIIDSKGKKYTLTAEELRLAFNTDAPKFKDITGNNRVWSGDLRISLTGSTLYIEGRGFGHGVGLCQFGASGLAKQGLSAQDILARYYPGATISNSIR